MIRGRLIRHTPEITTGTEREQCQTALEEDAAATAQDRMGGYGWQVVLLETSVP